MVNKENMIKLKDLIKDVSDVEGFAIFGRYDGVIDLHEVGEDKVGTVYFSFK